jgi:Aspartate/tyrosine/aromatic aminotransferase
MIEINTVQIGNTHLNYIAYRAILCRSGKNRVVGTVEGIQHNLGYCQDCQDLYSFSPQAMPERSILFLQTSSHNPTGVDLSEDQWRQLAVVVKQRHLYPFFDMAYLGLTSGDFDKDAFSLRYFAKEVGQLCLAQSFSKNMGLYGKTCL